MTIQHGVLGVVCSSNNYDGGTDANMDLVIKCQLAAIGGLEKQVETMNTKLKGCKDQSSRACHFHVNSYCVIFVIGCLLRNFHFSMESSSLFVVLMSMTMVAWLVISLAALFKMKIAYTIASVLSGQMNGLRPSATILKEEVEEDFRTNVGVRDSYLYSRILSRIRRLEFHMDHHQYICSDIKRNGTSAVMHSVGGWVIFAVFMKAMLLS